MVENKEEKAAASHDADGHGDDHQGASENQEQEGMEMSQYNLKILPLTHELHQKHGLRHNDFQRYRGYCARRIARIRKATKMVQGEKKKFHKKVVNQETLKEEKHLQIPLMTVERAWAYAKQLKFEMNTEPRKKYHMISRLRKAQKESEKLKQLVMETDQCNARTKLEAQAYHSWITGTLHFELQNWSEAGRDLTAARTIYEKLSSTLTEDEAQIYKQRMNEIIPNLRFCAYHSGDEVAKHDLMNLRSGAVGGVDDLLNQAREEQASTLQETEWRGRKMAVKQEKVRVFLLRQQEFPEELENAVEKGIDAVIEVYESLLLDCKDAIQVLRDDLKEDPIFRQRQQGNEGPVSSAHFLYTYLTFIKCSSTIDRNLAMIEHMKKNLEAASSVESATSKRPVKAQELVRLYESIIQNLSEMPQLAGLEEDIEFRQETEAKIGYFKAWRCLFIAQSFLGAQKWAEAMALYQRATIYGKKAMNDTVLEEKYRKQIGSLLAEIESRQFMAHANSILDAEESKGNLVTATVDTKVPLSKRLDTFVEDSNLVNGNPNLTDFPPAFTAIPCKPIFLDLAREQLAFPPLDDQLPQQSNPGAAQGQGSGGWLGGWLGGWGGGKKK